MPDGLGDATRRAVDAARQEAGRLGHRHVGTEHLLLGLLADPPDPAANALRQAGATPEGTRAKVIEAVGRGDPLPDTEPAFTARATRAIERASRFSLQRRQPRVGTEDLLLGVLDVEGTAGQVLRGLGVDIASLRTDVRAIAPIPSVPEPRVPEAGAPEAVAGENAGPGAGEPRCRGCGAALEGVLAHRPLASSGPAERRQVVAVYCSGCGTTLGILPR